MKTSLAGHKISRREWLVVIALLLIAFALRTHDVQRVPPGFHNDEVAFAEITETVTHGRLAIFFPENIGNEGLAYYFAAPFMKILGLNVLAIRLPAAFISLIAAVLIWALARRWFGPVAAVTALAAFSVAFWPVAFGRIGLHVVMLVPLATLAAYSIWRAQVASGRRVNAWWALSGVCIGLSIDTYTAGRILPAILVLFGGYILIARRAEWRAWWRGITIALVAAAIVAAPLFITLAQAPADEDQLGFFDIDRPLRELRQGNLLPVIETALNTLGMFAFVGDPLPYYAVPNRPVFEPISAALLLLGLLYSLWHWRQPKYAFVVLWFFVSLAPGMLSQPAPNSTRTLGVQTVVFALLGLGVAEVVKRFSKRWLYAGLTVLFAGNLIWTAHDYFTLWPSIDTVRFWHQSGLKAVADAVQNEPDTSPVVICLPDHLIDEREPWWYPAWRHMRFLVQRSDVSVRYYNCADTLILPEGAARYAFPDATDDATLAQFPIYEQFLAPSQLDRTTLPDRLGVILKADRSATPLDRQLANSAQNKVFYEGKAEAVQRPIDLGGKIGLVGYMLSRTGSEVILTTYWRATNQLPPQVSQFTHVLNDKDEIVTQADRLMLTSQSLRPGDVIAQIHHLTLPEGVSAGSYRIAIGLYTQPDGKRLPVMDNGQLHGDRIFLETIDVR
ncbi:MAG: glycosyltransferase family 39 protein [Thermoflexales bacterium]|nr:glycosyltransferase family 39 protein [Thermoflexales bacterium]